MKFLKSNNFFFRFVGDNLHYAGLIIVAVLAWQTQQATQLAHKTLSKSIERQQTLRDLLWLNLLTQRATVVAMSSVVNRDPEAQESASLILDSVGGVVSDESLKNDPENLAELEQLKKILSRPLTKDTSNDFLQRVESLGGKLNASESEQWFSLLDQNEHLLSNLAERRYYAYFSYALFGFYIFSLGVAIRRRKRAESFLIESEKRSRNLADASFEGLAICRDSFITEVNRAFCALFEVSAAEAEGRPLTDFVSGTVGDGETLKGLRKVSGTVPVEISVKESKNADETMQIVAIRDLSERYETENLRLEKEAAERANLSKSMFLANMSHELRTPMHGVLSFARFGLRDAESKPAAVLREYFQEIYTSGSNLMQLLNDLLDLSKLEAGKMDYSMEAADLMETVERVIAEMAAFASEKNIRLALQGAKNSVPAVFDQVRISQVIRNIVSNAIKFSTKGSEVTCEVVSKERSLEIRISNLGKGIPPDELETIFDKFVQSTRTKSGAGGTGLGLAICREIIQNHKGRIWAESVASGMTTFVFELPLNALEKKYG